jgi:hypothetical protein
MATKRYARALAPSKLESVPGYLNNEHLKLESVIDALLARLADAEARLAAGGL